MFKRLPKTLTANLATSGTLKLGVLDKVALRDSGHRLFANGVRYNANTDFTIAADPDTGEGTLTWLHATTLTSGLTILLAIAFIDSISSSDGSGGGSGDASAAKQDEQTAVLEDIETALTAPVSELPKTPLLSESDMVAGNVSRTGAGETTMVAAVSGQTTKLHAYAVTVPGPGTVEIRNGTGGTVLRKHVFPDKGGLIRDERERPYAKTGTNTALVFYWSGSGEANIDFDTKTGA